jgi:hypothetical protein
MNFSDSDLKAMQNDATLAGIQFTLKEIAELLANDKSGRAEDIWDDFESVGHPSGEYGMDTMVRDMWFSLIGQAYVGRNWPTYGEGEQVRDKFYAKLTDSLNKAGIKYI